MKHLNRLIFSATSYLLYALPAFATHDPLHTFASQPSCLVDFLDDVFTFIMSFVGVISLIVIIIGGYRYMTSTGDKYKVQDAQGTVAAGVAGLVIALIAFLVTGVVWSFMTGQPWEPTNFLKRAIPGC